MLDITEIIGKQEKQNKKDCIDPLSNNESATNEPIEETLRYVESGVAHSNQVEHKH